MLAARSPAGAAPAALGQQQQQQWRAAAPRTQQQQTARRRHSRSSCAGRASSVRAAAAPAGTPYANGRLRFSKYQGLGNDFILVRYSRCTRSGCRAPASPAAPPPPLLTPLTPHAPPRPPSLTHSPVDNRHSPEPVITPEQAARLCDRHFGVGGDGVSCLAPSSTRGPGATAPRPAPKKEKNNAQKPTKNPHKTPSCTPPPHPTPNSGHLRPPARRRHRLHHAHLQLGRQRA